MTRTAGPPHRAERLFRLLLVLTTGLRLAWIALPGLKYEEAYYWNYSQHPDLSYFDHPPMVAWLIGLSTGIGGNDEFWVRLPAVLLFAGTLWFAYRLAAEIFEDPWAGLATAVVMSVLPIFSIFAMLIFPDTPLLFFWTLGAWCGWRLVSTGNANGWWAVGVATGLGLLSKYPAALIPLGPLLFLAITRRWHLLLAPQMFGAAALALALFAPVLLWNAQHGWASLLFQGTERMGEATGLKESLASYGIQIGVLGISGFFALAWAVLAALPRWRDPRYLYLLCGCVPFLALMVYVSTRRLVQMNWPMPAYVTAVVLLAALMLDRRGSWSPWRWRLTALAVAGPALALTGAALLWLVGVVPLPLNSADDFNGWDKMGQRMEEIRAEMPRPDRTFLAGHGYQSASEVAYYARQPGRTLANNVVGDRAKGYDFWADPADFRGWDAVYLVHEEPRSNGGWRQRTGLDPARLQALFERVEGPESLIVFRYGKPLRRYTFFRCFGYRGPPASTD